MSAVEEALAYAEEAQHCVSMSSYEYGEWRHAAGKALRACVPLEGEDPESYKKAQQTLLDAMNDARDDRDLVRADW